MTPLDKARAALQAIIDSFESIGDDSGQVLVDMRTIVDAQRVLEETSEDFLAIAEETR